ncbi:MAG: substrate-binding domain-containing protein [Succinivibrio sp.]|nr:substrate-binding domain-containing protein [Succinivibrio sp.]
MAMFRLTVLALCSWLGLAQAAELPRVCAVAQTYSVLEELKTRATQPFETFYGPEEELYARLNEDGQFCQILISADERLPILAIRAEKAQAGSMRPVARAPLVLWTLQEGLLEQIRKARLKLTADRTSLPRQNQATVLSPWRSAASEFAVLAAVYRHVPTLSAAGQKQHKQQQKKNAPKKNNKKNNKNTQKKNVSKAVRPAQARTVTPAVPASRLPDGLRSLALPKAELTPVGYAAAQLIKAAEFDGYCKSCAQYKTDNEFQVLGLIKSGQVQAGLLTLPLIKGAGAGGYWRELSASEVPDLYYYETLGRGSAVNSAEVRRLYEYLYSDPAARQIWAEGGFARP